MAESSADFGGGVSYSHTQVAQSSNFDRLSEGSGATEDGDAEVDYTMKVLSQLILLNLLRTIMRFTVKNPIH